MKRLSCSVLIAAWLTCSPVSLRGDEHRPAAPPKPAVRSFRIPHTPTQYEFVRIPGGKVTVPGVEEGSDPVTVEVKPFWMGRTEITWDCYETWALHYDLTKEEIKAGIEAKSRPSKPHGDWQRDWGGANRPAIGMAVEAIPFYCAYLERKTGVKFRLPTEAEWIYACRAGASDEAKDRDALKKVAWFRDNAKEMTHPVASLAPNAFGLYDMLGNATEWVQPLAREEDPKIAKGGSYKSRWMDLRTSARDIYKIDDWQMRDCQDPKSKWWLSDGPFVGFRLVCDEEPVAKKKYP